MSRFILIRHAAVGPVATRIAGRLPNIELSEAGRQQARKLLGSLAAENIWKIFSSPRERAYQTAAILAEKNHQQVTIAADLDELDYGQWTGADLEQLDQNARWRAFNSIRSCTRIPGGELILEVQMRVVGFIDRLHEQSVDGAIVLVTHADIIRAALAYYLAMPIDLMLRFDISPASISILTIHEHGPTVLCVNCTGESQ